MFMIKDIYSLYCLVAIAGSYCKKMAVILFLLFISILPLESLFAATPTETTPCEPCQTADSWTGPYTYTTSSAIAGSACTLTVTYYTRICTFSQTPEIKIENITPGSNCSTLSYTAEEFAILAMASLLKDNPMGFAPTTVGARAVWNVIRPACWQIQPTGNIAGCSGECCTSQVRAEMFACDENTMLGLSDHGYPTVLQTGPSLAGCICKCTGIFERYRQIMTATPSGN